MWGGGWGRKRVGGGRGEGVMCMYDKEAERVGVIFVVVVVGFE